MKRVFFQQSKTGFLSTKTNTYSLSHGYRSFHKTIFQNKLVKFNLADIGEGIKEVEVLKWHIEEGMHIHQFDKVAEVQSDKATVEITSRFDGVVKKLYHKVGQIALVGRPLIDIEVEGEETKIVTPDVKEPVATPKTVSPVTKPMDQYEISDKVKTTPSVRRMARDENIDLTKVTPSGRDGRILKQDVMSFMENKQEVQKPTIGDREEPVRGLMRTMIKTMEAASQVPHLGYMDDIYMDKLIQARQEMNQILLKSKNKITFMPFFIKAASLALTQYPIINSQLSSDKSKITYKGSHNIGIAMDTKVGLLVPNIKNVQNLSLMEISVELNRLSALGEQGKLGEADLKGGTFSISNVGTIGGTYASPILVVPEVAICALGKMRKIPVFNEKNEVVGKQVVNISWSADHRIVDGATIARFSNALKFYIENPIALMTGLKNE